MSAEEMLEEIEKLSPHDAYIRGRCDMWDAINSNDRKEMLADIEQILRNLEKAKSMTKPNKWIPVSERLPEKCGYYLVSTMSFLVVESFYNGEKFWYEREEYFFSTVLAWMPLPEPYKQEVEDEN